MKIRTILGAVLFSITSLGHAQPPNLPEGKDDGGFEAIDIIVDSGALPLAAYQFELVDRNGNAKLVGVEGGEHAAFHDAPYYDPAALMQNRIIVGAFDVGDDLPAGKTRVARLHFVVDGEANYELELSVAATTSGEKITSATAEVIRAR